MADKIKTLQVKIHNLSNFKKDILNKTINNYNKVYNILLEKAYNDLDNITNNHKDIFGNYSSKSIQSFFNGITEHKDYGLEPLSDALKKDVASSIASYLELKKIDEEKAEYPHFKDKNTLALKKKISRLNNSLINNINLSKEQIHDIEQSIKNLNKEISQSNKLRPITFGRNRDCNLLYCSDNNKYYLELYLLNANDSKRLYENKTNTYQNKFNQLYYVETGEKYTRKENKALSRIIFPLEFGKWHEKYLKMVRNKQASIRPCKIIKRDNEFYIDIPIKFTCEEDKYNVETIMGIDLGVKNIATISIVDKNNLKNVIFEKQYNRDDIKINNISYTEAMNNLDLKLVKCQANGSNSYPLDKKFIKSYLYIVAKDIIHYAEKYKSSIVMEKLKKIDSSKNKVMNNKKFENFSKKGKHTLLKTLNKWSRGQITNILEEFSVHKIRKIDPKFTSEECFMCGHNEVIHSSKKSSNREGDIFICKACGFTIQSDFNGARNIAVKNEKPIVLRASEKNNIFTIKDKNFDFSGEGDSLELCLKDFVSKLTEYKEAYTSISFEKKKEDKKLMKQYAYIKRLEYNDNEEWFKVELVKEKDKTKSKQN